MSQFNDVKAEEISSKSVRIEKEAVHLNELDNGNSSTAITIDWKRGQRQKVTINGNCTFTFSAPTGPCNLILKIVHDATATAYTRTFSPVPKWQGATAPTFTNTANSVDLLCLYFDGINYYAQLATNFV